VGPISAGTAAPTLSQARKTVHNFLGVAVLEHNGSRACRFLTGAEQQRVARLGGPGATCREVFDRVQPSLRGVPNVEALNRLDVRATVRGGTAQVTARPRGQKPITFVLRRATRAELSAFGAPQDPWRIDAGATALLHH
jgi:hypothetical protein